MRTYINQVVKPLHDIRHDYPHLHNPDPTAYGPSQVFARELRETLSWGLLYNSVRLPGHECVAVFRRRRCRFRCRASTSVMSGAPRSGRFRSCSR